MSIKFLKKMFPQSLSLVRASPSLVRVEFKDSLSCLNTCQCKDRANEPRVGSGKWVGSWVLIGLVHQAIDLVRGVAVLFGDQRRSLIKRGSLNRTEGDRRIVVWKYVIF